MEDALAQLLLRANATKSTDGAALAPARSSFAADGVGTNGSYIDDHACPVDRFECLCCLLGPAAAAAAAAAAEAPAELPRARGVLLIDAALIPRPLRTHQRNPSYHPINEWC